MVIELGLELGGGDNGDDDAIDDEVEIRRTEPRNDGVPDGWNVADCEISDNRSGDL